MSAERPYQWVLECTRDTLSGVLGGVACVYSTQPLDTTKVKMQTFPDQYKSVYGTLSKTFRAEGIRGLYAGSIPAVWANIGESGSAFLAYGRISNMIQRWTGVNSHEELPLFHKACCGAGAGGVASFILTPTELIKCRLQTQFLTGRATAGSPTTPMSMAWHIIKKEGPMALMRGWTPTLAREAWGYFFLFGGYEASWVVLGLPEEGVPPPMWKSFIAGGIGGSCCWGFAFPLDVIKSRVQVDSTGITPIAATKDIMRTQGPKGFFRGLSPCLMRAFPGCGMLFVAAEYTKTAFNYFCDLT